MKMRVAPAAYASAGVAVASGDVLNLAWNEAYLATVNDGSTATGTITGTVGAVPYTNTFTMVVKRDAAWTAPTSVTGIALNTPVNSGLLPVNDFNVPVTVSFANPTTGTIDPMGSVSVAVNGVSTTVTLGTTTVTLNPGDTFQLFGSTGGTNNKEYGISVTIGTAAPQEWYVKTTPTAPSIGTPQIQTPGNNTTGVGTASGIIITGDTYDPLNGAGAQSSSTWEVYSGSYPLTSTNTISGVMQNAATPWTQQTSSFGTTSLSRSAYGDGLWVATGETGKLATSPDGITWTQRTSSFGGNVIQDVAYNNGLFVAVGDSGKLATSPDGITWTQQTSSFGTTNILSVAYGNGLWVATGGTGKLATSPDGITWTQRTSSFGTTNIFGVAYGNGLWVATGDTGQLATSPDGITWTQRTSGTTQSLYYLTFGGGLFVVPGNNGTIVTSPDGVTWTTRTGNFGLTAVIQVAYGNGLFVAVGLSGKLATSPDGITWTQRTSSFGTTNILGVAYGNGLWVATGGTGQLATSPTPGGSTTLTIAGCQTAGFLAGDTVVSGSGAAAGPATILSLDNTQAVVVPPSTNWVGTNTQTLARATSSYTAVTGSPYTVTTSPLESLTVPKPPLAANTKYYVRVRYSTTTPSAIDSDWSPWSGFTTGNL
jgi:hypothetical protein